MTGVKSYLQYCYEGVLWGFKCKVLPFHGAKKKEQLSLHLPTVGKDHVSELPGGDFKAIRDRTILTMLIDTGIRCLELCSIRPSDIHEDYIIIRGKNHKQKSSSYHADFTENMVKYEAVKESYFRYKKHG